MPESHTLRIDAIHHDTSGTIELAGTVDAGTPEEAPSGRVFQDVTAMLAFGNVLLAFATIEEAMMRFYLAWWAARDPDFGNENLVLGKTLTVDFGAVIPISRSA